jgi:4-hydroxy-3-polyprenylbenzoate decarboxylase
MSGTTDRVIVGVTGATGQIYAIVALELLAGSSGVETHLVLSDAAKVNIRNECQREVSEVKALADHSYDDRNIGASIASGSFRTAGMLVAPCSMKTLADIAHGSSGNLVTRAADVTLKERRPLVVMPREKPFNRIHIENMLKVTEAGAIVMPPFPSFYNDPDSIEGMVRRTVARALDQFGLDIEYDEWTGLAD